MKSYALTWSRLSKEEINLSYFCALCGGDRNVFLRGTQPPKPLEGRNSDCVEQILDSPRSPVWAIAHCCVPAVSSSFLLWIPSTRTRWQLTQLKPFILCKSNVDVHAQKKIQWKPDVRPPVFENRFCCCCCCCCCSCCCCCCCYCFFWNFCSSYFRVNEPMTEDLSFSEITFDWVFWVVLKKAFHSTTWTRNS